MRVAIYARKSQENEAAVERQVENARAFATSKGWSVSDAHVFTDDGISGAEFIDRPGFTAMLAAAKSKPRPFDCVVMMSVDRFGRETYRTNMALLELAEAGVRIFTYSDGQEVKVGSPIEKQMVSMRNYAAEDFRQQIADKTREAMRAKAKLGHVTGTRTYGYDHVDVDGHVERRINPAEAAIIERIFTLSGEGHGNLRIVNLLQAENVPAPGRKGWSKQVLRTLLSNRLYIGVIEFGKSRSAARGGSASRREARPMDDWTIVQRPELRIVEAALWKEVHARKAKTAAKYVRTPNGRLLGNPESIAHADHRLSGIAKCGVCGGSLVFTRKNERTASYYCSTRINKGTGACSNGKGVPEKKLDLVTVREITNLLDEQQLQDIYDTRAEGLIAEYKARSGDRAHLESEALKLEAAIVRLTDAIEGGQPVGNRLKERQAELDALRVKLAEPAPEVNWSELRKRLAMLSPMLDGAPVVFRQGVHKAGVQAVTVTPEADGGWQVEGRADLSRLFFGNIGIGGSGVAPPDP